MSFAEAIAVVIATILMTGMTVGVMLVLVAGGLMIVEQLSRLDLDLLWIEVVAIILITTVFVAMEFARRASIAIRQPVTKQVSDDVAN